MGAGIWGPWWQEFWHTPYPGDLFSHAWYGRANQYVLYRNWAMILLPWVTDYDEEGRWIPTRRR